MFEMSRIRGPVGARVTAKLALDIGRALAADNDRVVVGRDPRHSGRILADAVSTGARECGADVVRLGVAASPTVARSVGWRDAGVGVVVTGSHNPPTDNGLKLFHPDGLAFSWEQQRRLLGRVSSRDVDPADWQGMGREETWDAATDRHVDRLCADAPRFEDLSAVVDVGNGAGGYAVDALSRLGCSVESLYDDPDGEFPGRGCAASEAACDELAERVAESDADFGVALAPDAGRLQAVTERGRFVPGDALLGLFATTTAEAGTRVAIPVDTSRRVDELLDAVGASAVRTSVGDTFVSRQTTAADTVFGGEPGGAWIWPDEIPCSDAGYAARRLARLVDDRGPLSTLVRDVEPYPIRRGTVPVDDKRETMSVVRERITERYDRITADDGVQVDTDDGWFLVRPSRTESVVRVTAEAGTPDGADALFEDAYGLVVDDASDAAVEGTTVQAR